MLIVSFNVNSIRTRLHQLEAVIDKYSPTFIGLQETKVVDDDFPIDHIEKLGYEVKFTGQKTHYGVALLSKLPFESSQLNFPGDDESAQKRFVSGEFRYNDKKITVMNGYFPQGESREHPVKFPNKQKYYEDLQHYVTNLPDKEHVIVMGDLNVAPQDMDIGIGDAAHKRWLKDGKCSFLPEEREWFQRLEQAGYFDTYRSIHPDNAELFSWFDYRSKGFEREPKRGLRIDFVLASKALNDKCIDAGIDYDIRAMERPSDHCPVWSKFDF
ncbi:Exodeoxyribonuclease III [Thalassocella blandensis]|nr:Exodeoxyribonuclease III [Thalassocella blandensis]